MKAYDLSQPLEHETVQIGGSMWVIPTKFAEVELTPEEQQAVDEIMGEESPS